MAFKLFILCAVMAVASAGLSSVVYSGPVAHYAVANPSVDAVAETQQNVVRSHAGTVSQYSKAVDTPYSSVRKSDTRINNNVYTPTYTKTLTYAAPAPVVKYAASPAVYSHQVLAHASPAVYGHHSVSPATVYSHAAPVIAQPASKAYVSHVDPSYSAYSSKTVSYSPAAAVAHVTFDGFGAHYGY